MAANSSASIESTSITESVTEKPNLVVYQPQKLEGLLETISLLDKISERIGEDRSGDWSSSGSGSKGSGKGDDSKKASPRDKAIAALPAQPKMQKKLQRQIKRESKKLQHDIKSIIRLRRPGAAYKLNELYKKLRQLNALLQELISASYEVIKRLYVRVFIDKQAVLQA